MLVSVIVPFHEDLLKLFNSVESVNNQKIQKDTRLEVIIGNDSNLDNQEIYNKLKIFKNFEIKVIKNHLAKGSGNNRNTAMRVAKGKFFAFLDSDDIWHPNKIRMQIAQAKKGYTFICTNYSFLETGKIIKSPKKILNSFHIFFSKPIGSSTVMISKSFTNQYYFNNEKYCQDIIYWSKLAKLDDFKYCCVPSNLVKYSIEGETSKTSFLIKAKYMYLAARKSNMNIYLSLIATIYYGLRGLKNRYFNTNQLLNFVYTIKNKLIKKINSKN